MDRRRFLLTSLAGALAGPLAVEAQQAGKVYRMGYLATGSSTMQGFREALRSLGWVESQNLVIEYRWAEGRYDRLPRFAADFVRLKVDVILAITTPAALAAKEATSTIPIVFVFASEPVKTGLVTSLAHPGQNLTGVADSGLDLVEKRLDLLKELDPKMSRVAALGNPTSALYGPMWAEIQARARRLGVDAIPVQVTAGDQLEAAFAQISHRANALMIVPDAMLFAEQDRVVELAAKYRLPAVYDSGEFAHAGGLLSYGASLVDQSRRAAVYVDRILKGAKPANLPVEQPTKFELVINRKTAKALGLTIPPSLLARADQVIE